MQAKRRVYRTAGPRTGWLKWLLLSAAAVIALGGLNGTNNGDAFSISPSASPTAIPLDEAFDSTFSQREITLPASSWYALQLGSFETEEAAGAAAKQYVKRGAAGYVWKDQRFRMLAAVYPDKADAQSVREQLRSRHGVEAYLFEVELPSLTLRLKGMAGQLDILQAAFLHAQDLLIRQQEISQALDRQEISAEETVKTLETMAEQASEVVLRLRQRFSSPRHAAVNGMLECLEGYIAGAAEFANQPSSVLLGAAIRRQTLDTLYRLTQVYHILGNT